MKKLEGFIDIAGYKIEKDNIKTLNYIFVKYLLSIVISIHSSQVYTDKYFKDLAENNTEEDTELSTILLLNYPILLISFLTIYVSFAIYMTRRSQLGIMKDNIKYDERDNNSFGNKMLFELIKDLNFGSHLILIMAFLSMPVNHGEVRLKLIELVENLYSNFDNFLKSIQNISPETQDQEINHYIDNEPTEGSNLIRMQNSMHSLIIDYGISTAGYFLNGEATVEYKDNNVDFLEVTNPDNMTDVSDSLVLQEPSEDHLRTIMLFSQNEIGNAISLPIKIERVTDRDDITLRINDLIIIDQESNTELILRAGEDYRLFRSSIGAYYLRILREDLLGRPLILRYNSVSNYSEWSNSSNTNDNNRDQLSQLRSVLSALNETRNYVYDVDFEQLIGVSTPQEFVQRFIDSTLDSIEMYCSTSAILVDTINQLANEEDLIINGERISIPENDLRIALGFLNSNSDISLTSFERHAFNYDGTNLIDFTPSEYSDDATEFTMQISDQLGISRMILGDADNPIDLAEFLQLHVSNITGISEDFSFDFADILEKFEKAPIAVKIFTTLFVLGLCIKILKKFKPDSFQVQYFSLLKHKVSLDNSHLLKFYEDLVSTNAENEVKKYVYIFKLLDRIQYSQGYELMPNEVYIPNDAFDITAKDLSWKLNASSYSDEVYRKVERHIRDTSMNSGSEVRFTKGDLLNKLEIIRVVNRQYQEYYIKERNKAIMSDSSEGTLNWEIDDR